MRDPKWVAIVSFELVNILYTSEKIIPERFLPPEYNVKALLLEPSSSIVSPTSGSVSGQPRLKGAPDTCRHNYPTIRGGN